MLLCMFELLTEANPTSECILISLRSLISLGGVLNIVLGKLINLFSKLVKNLVNLWAGVCPQFTTGLCDLFFFFFFFFSMLLFIFLF